MLGGRSTQLGISIGIARYPLDGNGPGELLKSAGIALSRAKAEGGGLLMLFEPEMERSLRTRRTLQTDLREAIADGSLDIAFQPQFNAQTLQVAGFEALARWQHPKLGEIKPALFIRIAEEAGLIDLLGEQMLRRACRIAATWPRKLRIGVNLSPLQFRDRDLPERVSAILAATHLDPSRLELEVTEGVLIREEKQAHATLSALSAQGIRLALDDFGTGYSSLSYLRRFHFDTLKIDKSFVQSLGEDQATRAILDAIMAMALRLNLEVIAEGVETEAQMVILQTERCTEIQGFLLGRPMSERQALDLILNG
jgi:EAL domain-containing protein (putative c-di-GMP-specific phosphodiesterase class I)